MCYMREFVALYQVRLPTSVRLRYGPKPRIMMLSASMPCLKLSIIQNAASTLILRSGQA